MKIIRRWLVFKILRLCDLALNNQDYAESQEEINDVVATRNAIQRKINAMDNCIRCMSEGASCQCGFH